MAYKSRQTYKTETAGKFTSGSDKFSGQEVEDMGVDVGDSAGWEDQKYSMGSNTYDCNNGNLQERVLSGNGTLVISNAVAGKYYTLIKKGSYTLTLPTSQFSASGTTTGTGTTIVTFLYDGTNLFFSFSPYVAT